jgi:DNA-binding HxlR family transcriptional regulator
MSTTDPDWLAEISRHRWTATLIAAIARTNGARFVELLHSMRSSRESLSRTLEHAVLNGWVMRNSGHGHPLRPEYLLSDKGKAIAAACERIVEAEARIGLQPSAIGRWSRPIIRVIGGGEHRYAAIARSLPASNPRALTQNLKSLVSNQLVMRTIIADYPPAAEYHLSPSGAGLANAFAEFTAVR